MRATCTGDRGRTASRTPTHFPRSNPRSPRRTPRPRVTAAGCHPRPGACACGKDWTARKLEQRAEEIVDAYLTAGLDRGEWRSEDERKPSGRPEEGITDRKAIIEMLVGYTTKVRCKIRKGVIEPCRRGNRSLQELRAGLVATRASEGNAEALAEIFDVKGRTIRNWRAEEPKISINSPIGRDMEQLATTLSAIRADTASLVESQLEVRGLVLEMAEILRANFPDDARVAAAVDEFIENSLAD
jgi:hypothetical protein